MSQAAKRPSLDRKGSAGNTMGRPQGRSRGRSSNSRKHSYPREARISETVREVVAEELLRIDDDRLAFVAITAIDVDAEMNRAIVYFDSMFGEEGDEGVVEALLEFRPRIQASINRQMHARKTPILSFRPDEVIRSAARIEELLRKEPDTSPISSRDDAE